MARISFLGFTVFNGNPKIFAANFTDLHGLGMKNQRKSVSSVAKTGVSFFIPLETAEPKKHQRNPLNP